MKKIYKLLGLTAVLSSLYTGSAYAELTKEEIANFNKIAKENPELIVDLFSKDRDTFYQVYYQTARDYRELFVSVLQEVDNDLRVEAFMAGWAEDIKTAKNPVIENRPVRGNPNAPITLYAFSDFTCSFCAQGATTVENLISQYPNDIRYVFKSNIVESEYAEMAAMWFLAAYNADEAKGWNFYKSLYANQQVFFSNPESTLKQIANQVGLDAKAIEKDVNKNEKKYMNIINEDRKEAQEYGFEGTPYYLMNDITIRGAVPLNNFVDAYNFVQENNIK